MQHVSAKIVMPFDFQGLQIRELTPGGFEAASVAEIEVAVGVRHQRARSTRSDKLYLCAQGTVSFRVGDTDIWLEPRDLLLIRKNEWFGYHNPSGTPARLILVHIPPFDLGSEEFRDDV